MVLREQKAPKIVPRNVCMHVLITKLNISFALILSNIFWQARHLGKTLLSMQIRIQITKPRRKKKTNTSSTSFKRESLSSWWASSGATMVLYRTFLGINCALAIDTMVFLIFNTLIGIVTARRLRDVRICNMLSKGHIYERIPLRKMPITKETTN